MLKRVREWFILIGFLILPALGFADTNSPAASIPHSDQMADRLSKSLESAKKIGASNEDLIKKLDEFSSKVDTVRIQFRRNKHR